MATRTRAGSALRFLLVGGTTVLIDAAVYTLLDALGLHYDIAKTISFLSGAVFAYFANWRFTFGGHRNRWSELLFALVYLCALGINIALNGLLRSIDPGSVFIAALAFLVATAVSAVWNFIGMSLFVFRRTSSSADAAAAVPEGATSASGPTPVAGPAVDQPAVALTTTPPPIRQ